LDISKVRSEARGEANSPPSRRRGGRDVKKNAAKLPFKGADGVVVSSYRLFIPNGFDKRLLETTTPIVLRRLHMGKEFVYHHPHRRCVATKGIKHPRRLTSLDGTSCGDSLWSINEFSDVVHQDSPIGLFADLSPASQRKGELCRVRPTQMSVCATKERDHFLYGAATPPSRRRGIASPPMQFGPHIQTHVS
jgi:hypothetical protein